MIARILGEGQYEIEDKALDRLNVWDEQLEFALASGDETAFREALAMLLDGVRQAGHPLPVDRFVPSDVILPGADATAEDVSALLSDEGLIPD